MSFAAGTRLIVVILVVSVTAVGLGLWRAQRATEERFAPFTELAREYLARAATGDSVALSSLVTDSFPLSAILARYKGASRELLEVSRSMRATDGSVEESLAVVVYTTDVPACPGERRHGRFQFQWLRERGTWALEWAGVPMC